ncbi:MAG: DUF4159 domain-containing protein [Fibrobacter sp.]|nr:DUF4159 domain-containing protein [Fibrobacter sp.]
MQQNRFLRLFNRYCISLLLLLTGSFLSSVFSQDCQFTIARLKYGGGGDWYANPSSLPNLLDALKKRTSIPVCDTIAVVEIKGGNLFHFPLLYMTGHGDVKFTAQERIRLRKFLIGGGMLWADDNYGLDKSFRQEMQALFPENPLTEIPSSHPIYSSFYKLPGLPKIHEHDGKPAQGYGIFFEGRMVVFYSFSSDIGDGMEDLQVHNDGPELHQTALKMGINLVYWFLNP